MTPAYSRPLRFVEPRPAPAVVVLVTGPTDSLVRKGIREARALVRRIERKRRRAQ